MRCVCQQRVYASHCRLLPLGSRPWGEDLQQRVRPALFLTGSQTLTIQIAKHPKTLNPTAYQTFLTKIKVHILLRVLKTLTSEIW